MQHTPRLGLALVFIQLLSCPADAEDSVLTETSCSILATDDSGSTRVVALPSLHVLTQVSTSTFTLPKDAPPRVAGILCVRSSPVPHKNAYQVLLAGFPLMIVTGPIVAGGENRLVTLEIESGHLGVKYDRGVLTTHEEMQLQERIDEMQVAMQANP